MSASFVTPFDGWDLNAEADRRFRRYAQITLAIWLILGVLIPLLHITGLERGGGETLEPAYVNVLPNAVPAEKTEEPAPVEVPEPEPEPEPPAPEPPKPEPVPKPKPIQPTKPEPVVKPPQVTQQQRVQQARQIAAQSGVMAFANQLQSLHGNPQAITGGQPLSTMSSEPVEVGGDAQVFEQSAAQASSGIGNAAATGTARRAKTGTGLGTRRTTVVQSPVGAGPDRTRPGQGGDALIAGRTLEEIQLTFDRNKGAFYAIFNRALRVNPNLGAGKIVVSITITPDGSVSDVRLVSSTFHDAELESKVLQRVRLLNFGAKNVPTFTYPNYPINFLPP